MDSKTIRYKNTRLLIEQVGGISNFAEKTNKGQSQISQFAGSNPTKGIGNKIAREIELAFDKPHGWLDIPNEVSQIFHDSSISHVNSTYKHTPIPIITWIQAKTWLKDSQCYNSNNHFSYLPPNPKCDLNGFALIVTGESMQPDFRPEDAIYIKTNINISKLKTGDLVIVELPNFSEVLFKKLIVESGHFYLQALNPNWPDQTILLTDADLIIGQVIGLYRDIQ